MVDITIFRESAKKQVNTESAVLRKEPPLRKPLAQRKHQLGVAATWTVVPVVRESDGLTITLSDSVTPLRISD